MKSARRRFESHFFAAIAVALSFAAGAAGIAFLAAHLHSPLGRASAGDLSGYMRVEASAEETGRIASDEILESSGVACASAASEPASAASDLGSAVNYLWTHNDSGDAARLYLVSTRGELAATLEIAGAEARDWEDLCRFTWRDRQWLLIGDVGDNARRRECNTLYLVEEPAIRPAAGKSQTRSVEIAARIDFAFPDGPRDCESLAVAVAEPEAEPAAEPAAGARSSRPIVFLLSKEVRGRIYQLELPEASTPTPLTAQFVAETAIPFATALDISSDGRRAVALTYGDACECVRGEGETWSAAFVRPFRVLSMPQRRQGEAICFGETANELWLTSEGAEQPIWRVKLP